MKRLKKIWQDPVWAPVIAFFICTAIASAVPSIRHFVVDILSGAWSLVVAAHAWLTEPIPTPVSHARLYGYFIGGTVAVGLIWGAEKLLSRMRDRVPDTPEPLGEEEQRIVDVAGKMYPRPIPIWHFVDVTQLGFAALEALADRLQERGLIEHDRVNIFLKQRGRDLFLERGR